MKFYIGDALRRSVVGIVNAFKAKEFLLFRKLK